MTSTLVFIGPQPTLLRTPTPSARPEMISDRGGTVEIARIALQIARKPPMPPWIAPCRQRATAWLPGAFLRLITSSNREN